MSNVSAPTRDWRPSQLPPLALATQHVPPTPAVSAALPAGTRACAKVYRRWREVSLRLQTLMALHLPPQLAPRQQVEVAVAGTHPLPSPYFTPGASARKLTIPQDFVPLAVGDFYSHHGCRHCGHLDRRRHLAATLSPEKGPPVLPRQEPGCTHRVRPEPLWRCHPDPFRLVNATQRAWSTRNVHARE